MREVKLEEAIRLAVVDDQEIVRLGMRRLLEGQDGICLVGEAECGEEALRMATELQPQVMLVDVKLPDINGVEVVRRIKSDPRTSDIQCVMLTVLDDMEIADEALRAGAIGYLLKDSGREQILEAVTSAFRGVPLVSKSIAGKLLSTFYRSDRLPGDAAEGGDGSLALTGREYEVLRLVAKGYSNKAVARELDISLSTVKTHLRNVFRKMDVEDRAHLIIKAIKQGII